MDTFAEFFKSKRINDSRGIQKALRRIDTHILALSLVKSEKNHREIFYRNMTKRAVKILEKDIEEAEFGLTVNDPYIDGQYFENARKIVLEELINWTNEKYDKPQVYPNDLPDVKLDSFGNILQTFTGINDQCRKYGMFSINGIEDKTDNLLFKKGIEFIIDGTDPLMLEEIMENYIKSLSNKYIRELNMIWNALKLIQNGSTSFELVEKLKSLENS
jgi:hypothetical protein